ncbi:hypothetical protein ACIBED_05560 [Rhodococcus coprophilus]|uniref:Phospholipase A2 n=1 Tax=Rhodococcus coprophilus TaxID=38310 RepID=A0A2X4UG09_9NOCA|nr:hypothetical protein [Rhodococcus coprophilus]MBM7460263.1 hypothetical protein [Rhodococcus coprophilus]SQI38826.1 Uncharacterised protein [Rhodococcus coprophilus]
MTLRSVLTLRSALTLRSVLGRGAAVLLLCGGVALCVSATPSPAAGRLPSAAGAVPANEIASSEFTPAVTVHALATDDTAAALAALPAGFATAMGYSPVTEPGFTSDAVLVDPRGDCSSPVPLPSSFETACRTHDLGYDMLRYARDTGQELGPDARRELDAMLARHLYAACDSEAARGDITCRPAALVASTFVGLNSWRQGYRIPVSESPAPLLLSSGLGTVVVTWGVWARRKARR